LQQTVPYYLKMPEQELEFKKLYIHQTRLAPEGIRTVKERASPEGTLLDQEQCRAVRIAERT
jgi:hypothetical protein